MDTRTSFYSEEELREIGFKSYGSNLKISRFARFYSPQTISIGDNVRIDDFCILSGSITLGNNIHISAYVALYGAYGIKMEDYTGISARTTVYSAMDDFSGNHMIGPLSPEGTNLVTGGPVVIKKFVQIGAHSLIFPNLTIGEGSVVGALSMVRHSIDSWGIYYGVPVERIKERSKRLIDFIPDE